MATIASAERSPEAFQILSGNDYLLGNGLASRAVGVGVMLPVTPAFQVRSTSWKQSESNAESHEASNLG
jgi:hypothetical protein